MNDNDYEEGIKDILKRYRNEYLELSKKKDTLKNNRERLHLSNLIYINENNLHLLKLIKK